MITSLAQRNVPLRTVPTDIASHSSPINLDALENLGEPESFEIPKQKFQGRS